MSYEILISITDFRKRRSQQRTAKLFGMSDILRQRQMRCGFHTPLRTSEVQHTLSKQQQKPLFLKILELSAYKFRMDSDDVTDVAYNLSKASGIKLNFQ